MSPRRPSKIAPGRAQSEFALIDTFLKPFGISRDGKNFGAGSGVIVGPGDDCAQLETGQGMTLVATTDAAVEGVHFELGRSTAEDAGWKALAMNLSDLAAAGAKPRWFLCALGVPPVDGSSSAREAGAIARGFGRGMASLARRSGCSLVGGNLSRARQWSMTITALGEVKKPLSRQGGRAGDRLFVIGELGAAALGLRLLQASPARESRLLVKQQSSRKTRPGAVVRLRAADLIRGQLDAIQAQLRPEPQLAAGLVAARFASAAIDVSDGLLQDLGHLCARSGCGAAIDCDALPRSAAVQEAEQNLGHPYALSLAGGEDYALLISVPPKRTDAFLREIQKARLRADLIGSLTGQRKIELFDQKRAIPHPARPGYDHFIQQEPPRPSSFFALAKRSPLMRIFKP